MRVVLCLADLEPRGTVEQAATVAAGLARAGHEPHVVTLRGGEAWQDLLAAAGVGVHSLAPWRALDPFAHRRLAAIMRELRPEVVHAWDPEAARAAGIALSQGVPLVVSERRVRDNRGWMLRRSEARLARRAAAFVADCQASQAFAERRGVPAEKVHLIRPAVDPPTGGADREAVRAELGAPADARLVLAVGTLRSEMCFKDLIWVIDLLQVIRSDVHLAIVGQGPQLARLLRFRDQARVTARVHFVSPRSDVPRLLAASDVFWLAGAAEGANQSLLHALRAGLPVIAARAGGTPELVTDGENGRLIRPGDRAAWASATNQLLEDPAQAARFSTAARDRAAVDTTDRMVQAYLQLYAKVADLLRKSSF